MTRVQQKREELDAVERLQRVLHDFPAGEIRPSEEPLDVVVTLPHGQRIGIEVTSFVRDRAAKGSRLEAYQKLTRRIASECESVYRQRNADPVYVAMHFARELECRSRDVPVWAHRIVNEVARVAPTVTSPVALDQIDAELPVGLDRVVVYRPGAMTEPQFAPVLADFYGEIQPSDLQVILGGKEGRVHAYRDKCETAWLLIVVDGRKMSAWAETTDEVYSQTYITSFDRVLILYNDIKAVDLRLMPLSQ